MPALWCHTPWASWRSPGCDLSRRTHVGTAAEVNGGRRILFASESSWGHINPLISIAGDLAGRGIGDIWFASTDDRKAAIEAICGRAPVRFVSLGPAKPELDPANWPDETMRAMTTGSPLRNLAALLDVNLDHANHRQQYLRTLEVIDQLRPALAVIDIYTRWAIDAAAKRGVPYLLTCPSPVSLRPKHLRANTEFARTRRAEGLANLPARPSRYADGAVAVLAHSVFGIEYPFPDIPGNVKMLGAIIPRDTSTKVADGGGLAPWLDRHESVVYAAFGTVVRLAPRQIQAITDVAARLGPKHHVLWKLPRSYQRLLPDALPPNLRVESWVPSPLAVLAHPHVRVFFNHGGGNAINEGLHFGKPQLVMPFWTDNPDNAARVVDCGAGLAVPHASGAEACDLAAKLTRLLGEPGFQSRAEHWSRQMRQAGGVAAAADEITGVLDRLVRVSR